MYRVELNKLLSFIHWSSFCYVKERERFENEANELRKKIAEQTEFYEKEQQEHDRILRERLNSYPWIAHRSSCHLDFNLLKPVELLYWIFRLKKLLSKNDPLTYVSIVDSSVMIVWWSIQAHERTTEETDKLKTLKQKHDEVTKQMGDFSEASKALENSVSEAGKE